MCAFFFTTKHAANYSALHAFASYKKLITNAHHGFYPIYKNRETHQSGLHYLDKFWHAWIQVLAQIKFGEFWEIQLGHNLSQSEL